MKKKYIKKIDFRMQNPLKQYEDIMLFFVFSKIQQLPVILINDN